MHDLPGEVPVGVRHSGKAPADVIYWERHLKMGLHAFRLVVWVLQMTTESLFHNGIMENSDRKLPSLLPVRNSCPRSVRPTRMSSMPNRFQRSFIMLNAMDSALCYT